MAWLSSCLPYITYRTLTGRAKYLGGWWELNERIDFQAVKALLYMHPALYGTVESPEWKTYLGRPALKLVSSTMHKKSERRICLFIIRTLSIKVTRGAGWRDWANDVFFRSSVCSREWRRATSGVRWRSRREHCQCFIDWNRLAWNLIMKSKNKSKGSPRIQRTNREVTKSEWLAGDYSWNKRSFLFRKIQEFNCAKNK